MRPSFGNLGIAQRYRRPVRRAPVLPREMPGGREYFAPIELDPQIQKYLRPVKYDGPSPLQGRVHVIEGWDSWSMPRRVAFIRAFIEDTSRDPAIAIKAQQILREAGVPQRDHRAAWAALLKWVQTHMAYQNEPKERLQSPQHSLSTGGPLDCDDMAILLGALGWSIRLPFWLTLSGRNDQGERVRWVEGQRWVPFNASHIYLRVGGPPFKPTWSTWAEPTLDVPLGWDSFKDPIPRGREDLAGVGGLKGPLGAVASGLPATSRSSTSLVQKVKYHASKINWYQVAGVVVGGVASALLVRVLLGGKPGGRGPGTYPTYKHNPPPGRKRRKRKKGGRKR